MLKKRTKRLRHPVKFWVPSYWPNTYRAYDLDFLKNGGGKRLIISLPLAGTNDKWLSKILTYRIELVGGVCLCALIALNIACTYCKLQKY